MNNPVRGNLKNWDRHRAGRDRPKRPDLGRDNLEVEILEHCLDVLAEAVSKATRHQKLFVPLWKRIQLEIVQRKETEKLLSSIRKRTKRSQG